MSYFLIGFYISFAICFFSIIYGVLKDEGNGSFWFSLVYGVLWPITVIMLVYEHNTGKDMFYTVEQFLRKLLGKK